MTATELTITGRRSRVRRHGRRRFTFESVTRVVALSAFGLYFALPMIWVVLAPSKTRAQLATLGPYGFGSFENYGRAFQNLMSYHDGVLWTWVWNSVWYSVLSVLIALACCIPAGFALARTPMKWRRLILILTLVIMVTPGSARTIPTYLMLDAVGWLNSPLSVIIPQGFFPFGVYLTYIYFSTSLPPSLLEAARIDGASEWTTFWRIAVPLARPAVGLVTFFAFIESWNDFFGPYIYLFSEKLYSLPVGLASLISNSPGIIPGGTISDLPIFQPEVALAGMIVVVPILVIFLGFQRYLGAGVLDGAVKD
ncbi:carbohydrate ABC transporter permease [Leifsonia sp. TF02-11]|uniref:carbohydrate ABC transporter permease n=1 Tax=Leifsonia sp. TF02-11 TaxID=2815212 RepID=UPI001AA19F08|nr:carbohydrate ABC transporter permease [Leifsonia sp. TF02-11]MBO1741853.1 carbohydrate ABC transporter permease [Leifsonia sp. TF02-11]